MLLMRRNYLVKIVFFPLLRVMAVQVVEFSNEVYKIRKIFA